MNKSVLALLIVGILAMGIVSATTIPLAYDKSYTFLDLDFIDFSNTNDANYGTVGYINDPFGGTGNSATGTYIFNVNSTISQLNISLLPECGDGVYTSQVDCGMFPDGSIPCSIVVKLFNYNTLSNDVLGSLSSVDNNVLQSYNNLNVSNYVDSVGNVTLSLDYFVAISDGQICISGSAGLYDVQLDVESASNSCSFCTQSCSPCGGGCTATDLSGMYIGYNFAVDSFGVGDITGWNTSCITNMASTFQGSDFNQNISGWNVSSVTDMTNMFNGITLSTPIYDSILNGWSVEIVQPNVPFSGGNSIYTTTGQVGRNILTNSPNFWNITDGGLAPTTCDSSLSTLPCSLSDPFNYSTPSVNVSFTTITGDINSGDIQSGTNWIYVNSTSVANVPAIITFNNVSDTLTKILYKNGKLCVGQCSNIVRTANTITFNVSSFSNYSYGDGTPFVSRWDTTKGSPVANSTQILLPLVPTGTYNFVVDWGDNTTSNITTWNDTEKKHNYATPGNYTIIINGTIIGFSFGSDPAVSDPNKIIGISQWGSLNVGNDGYYFANCGNLVVNATDNLDLSGTTTLNNMFFHANKFNEVHFLGSDIGEWDVSQVTNMSNMFADLIPGSCTFNQNINAWNTSNVVDMNSMFLGCPSYNQPLNNWDTHNVRDMSYMFADDSLFNQDISGWNTSNVVNMQSMFLNDIINGQFNQPIGAWDTHNVTNMGSILYNQVNFNQNLNNWNTSKVTNMNAMFRAAFTYNQPMNNWDTSHVTDMSSMFSQAIAFNQPLNNWNTGAVTTMVTMFAYGFAPMTFNQDIGMWDVRNVTTMSGMFNNVTLSTTNYNALLNGWANQTVKNNVTFSGGNSIYSATASTSRNILTSTYNWTITDGGLLTFSTKWDTTKNTTGSSNITQIQLPLISTGTYNFNVDWGDNTTNTITVWNDTNTLHNYATPGNYTINITGIITGWRFFNGTDISGDRNKILLINSWGPINPGIIPGGSRMFQGCANVNSIATDNIDLTGVTDLSFMFASSGFNGNINGWNMSGITKIDGMFSTGSFNQPLNNWDTHNITSMSDTFGGASSFNQPLNNWNTSKVTDMNFMFDGAQAFNQNISGWDVHNVVDMRSMFRAPVVGASAFNQNLGSWNITGITNLGGAFNGMNNMFHNVNLSTTNYNALLIGWANQSVQNNIVFDGGVSQYTIAASSSRNVLTSTHNWTITDGGQAVCTPHWIQNTCTLGTNFTKIYTDTNSCGNTSTLPSDNGTIELCQLPFDYVWTDLSNTDAGNWVGVNTLGGIAYNPIANTIYTTSGTGINGRVGVYDPNTNIWINISSSSLTSSNNQIAFDNIHQLLFVGTTTNSIVNIYNATTNTPYTMATINTGAGNIAVNALAYDPINNMLYAGQNSGNFFKYNMTALSGWTNLSATDTGNWAGISSMLDLEYANGLIYTGLQGGKFGVYDPSTNIWTDLSATDTNPANWLATNTINSISYDNVSGQVYLGTTGNFGVYNITSNTATRLGTIPVTTLSYDSTNKLLYLTSPTGAKFQVYDILSTKLLNINYADAGNWSGIATVGSLAFGSNNLYTGLTQGKFGVLTWTSPCVETWVKDTTNACNSSAQQKIITYTDTHQCGTNYTLPVDNNTFEYCCIDTWHFNNTACNGINYTRQYYDIYSCGTYNNFPIDNGTVLTCSNTNYTFAGVPLNNSISNTSLTYIPHYSLVYANNTNEIYAGAVIQLLSKYNITTDTWTKASDTLLSGTTRVYGLEYDPINNIVYTGAGVTSTNNLGYWNITSNTWINLSATDTKTYTGGNAPNWASNRAVNNIKRDNNTGLIYTAMTSGGFGYYNLSNNTWFSISPNPTTSVCGVSGNVQAMDIDNIHHLIYVGCSVGLFGVYNITNNTWIDLSNTDIENWVGTQSIQNLVYDSNNNLVYLLDSRGKLGVYNPVNNQTMDITYTLPPELAPGGNTLSQNLLYDTDKDLLFTTGRQFTATYNPVTANWSKIRIINNWLTPTSYYGITEANGVPYIGSAGIGSFGKIINVSCVENWLPADSACISGNYTIGYYDNASCGSTDYLPIDNGTIARCAYNYVLDTWYDNSYTDRFPEYNWNGNTNQLTPIGIYNNSLYLAPTIIGQTGALAKYNPITDLTTYVITPMTVSSTLSIIINDTLYTSSSTLFYKYNITSGIATDLSNTDPGDWVGAKGIVNWVQLDDKIYTVVASGPVLGFGVYNTTDGVWYNLSDVANNLSAINLRIATMDVDEITKTIYLGIGQITGGQQTYMGIYNTTTNTLTSNTILLNLTSGVASLANIVYTNGQVFTGYSANPINISLGVFNVTSLVWTNLSNTDVGDWVGTAAFSGSAKQIILDSTHNLLYTMLQSSPIRFGVFDINASVWYNHSILGVNNSIDDQLPTVSGSLFLDTTNEILYASDQGGFHLYKTPYTSNGTCLENWVQDSFNCYGMYNYTISYTDYNFCGTTFNLPANNGTIGNCSILYPNVTTFDGATSNFTNLSIAQLFNFSGLILENTSNAKIEWNNITNVYGANFDAYVKLLPNSVFVDSTNLDTTINSSANVSIYNIFIVSPWVFRDGIYCPECSILSNNGSTIKFAAPSFSNYTLGNCSENWVQDSFNCYNAFNYTITYNDTNMCGTNYTLPIDNGTIQSCNISYPNATNFNGATTNFTSYTQFGLETLSNLVLENTSNGKIAWNNMTNVSAQNFDTYVTIAHNLAAVDATNLDPSINSSANISLYNIFIVSPWVLKDGIHCTSGGGCNILSNNGSTIVFSVPSFSNYTLGNCSENWIRNSPSTVCNGTINNYTITYNDTNMCGTNYTLPANNGTTITCATISYAAGTESGYSNKSSVLINVSSTANATVINVYNSTGNNIANNIITCYQDLANETTTCGGLNTGTYASTGLFDPTHPAIDGYDNNYSTYAQPNATNVATIYINRTIPSSTSRLSQWNLVTYSNFGPGINVSIIIPDDCWTYPTMQTSIEMFNDVGIHYVYPQCYNGTSWNILTIDQNSNHSGIYEAPIYWQIANGTSYNATNLSEGTYYYNATGYPIIGQTVSTPTQNIVLIQRFHNESYTITFPYPNNFALNSHNLAVPFTTTDPYYNYTIYHVQGLSNPAYNFNYTTTGTTYTYTLPDGRYYYSLTTYDKAGNSQLYDPNITIDTVAPVILYLANSTPNNNYQSGTNISVSLQVTHDTSIFTVINLYNNVGGLVATYNSTSQPLVNTVFTGLGNGTYYFNATSVDEATNYGYSGTRNATIITSFNDTAYNVTYNYPNDYVTNNATINPINFTTVDPYYAYAIYNVSGVLTNTTAKGFTTTLIEGIYNYNVRIYDLAGNNKLYTTQNITVDGTPPVITYIGATEGANSYIGFNRTNITVNIQVTDMHVNTSTNIIRLYDGANNLLQTANATNLTTFTGLTAGVYRFNASSTDTFNNTGNSVTRTVTIVPFFNTSAYTVNFVHINDTITTATFNAVNFTTTDPYYNQVTYGLSQIPSGFTASETTTRQFKNYTVPSDGTYRNFLTIFDLAGNSQLYEQNITVSAGIPTLAYAADTDNDNSYKNQPYIFVHILPNATNATNLTTIITLYNSTFGIISTANNTNTSNFTGLIDGVYHFNAVASNNGYNTTALTRTVTIHTSFSSGLYTVTFPTPNATLIGTSTFNATVFNTTDPYYSYAVYSISGLIYPGDAPYSDSENTTRKTKSWTSPDSDGYFQYSVTIYDLAGNSLFYGPRMIDIDTLYPTYLVDFTTEANNSYIPLRTVFGFPNTSYIHERIYVFDAHPNYGQTELDLYNGVGTLIGFHFGTFTANIADTYFGFEPTPSTILNLTTGPYHFGGHVTDTLGRVTVIDTRYVTIVTAFNTTAYTLTFPNANNSYIKVNSFIAANFTTVDPYYSQAKYDIQGITDPFYIDTITTANKTHNWTNLPDGKYYYSMTVYDLAGNTHYYDPNITIDTTPPTIIFTNNSDSNYTYQRPYLYLETNTTDTNINYTIISVYNSTGGFIGSNTSNNSITTYTTVNLTDAFYYFNATTYDLANNSANTATYQIELDYVKNGVQFKAAEKITDTQRDYNIIFNSSTNNFLQSSIGTNKTSTVNNIPWNIYNITIMATSGGSYYTCQYYNWNATNNYTFTNCSFGNDRVTIYATNSYDNSAISGFTTTITTGAYTEIDNAIGTTIVTDLLHGYNYTLNFTHPNYINNSNTTPYNSVGVGLTANTINQSLNNTRITLNFKRAFTGTLINDSTIIITDTQNNNTYNTTTGILIFNPSAGTRNFSMIAVGDTIAQPFTLITNNAEISTRDILLYPILALNIYDEQRSLLNQTRFNFDSPDIVKVTIYCTAPVAFTITTTIPNSTNSTYYAPAPCIFNRIRFDLSWDNIAGQPFSYYRTLTFPATTEIFALDVYLVDAFTTGTSLTYLKPYDIFGIYTVAQHTQVQLYEIFPTGNKLVTSDYVDAEGKMSATLMTGGQYIITVSADGVTTKTLGPYYADTAGTKILRLFDVIITGVPNGQLGTETTTDTQNNTVTMKYADTTFTTQSIKMDLFAGSCDTPGVFQQVPLMTSIVSNYTLYTGNGVATMTYTVPNGTSKYYTASNSTRYCAEYTRTDLTGANQSISGTQVYSKFLQMPSTFKDPWTFPWIVMILLIIIALGANARTAAPISLVIAMITSGLYAWNWIGTGSIPGVMPGIALGVVMLLAILFNFKRVS